METDDNLRTLFVEDSEVDVELIVLELQREGFSVDWERVEREDDLRKSIALEKPDIILSDYSMPNFSGTEALRIVREIDPDIPFIFVSGTIGEERAIESIRQGATDYILKGNLRRLGTAVRRALVEAEERRRSLASEEARSRLADILEATSDYVAIFDPDHRITFLNTAGRRLIGLGEDENIIGKRITDFHPEWAFQLLEREALAAVMSKGIWEGETALLNHNGKEVPLSQVVIGHRDSEGGLRYLSTIGRDIRDRKAYEEQIRYLANFDGLTDLPNRTLLRDRVLQSMVHARRSGRAIALLVANVDRFRLVNDGLGHETGDVLLRLIGDRLQAIIRDGDTVARLGADGFAILAVDMHRHDDVLTVARKIQSGIQSPLVVNGQETQVTLSIGASIFPRDGGDFESLLRNAEAAMHRAKAQGRNKFEYYTAEMTRDAEVRVDVENALRHALGQNELELHYQPLMELETGRIIGAEALMRWQREGHGWISPAQFIPVAEDSDLILTLGDFALFTACRQLRYWSDEFAETPLRMSVNVSARQFLNQDFVKEVGRVLRDTRIDPARMELELTESILIEDKDHVMAVLAELKRLGVRISVDDFGTGYSSLSYLSKLPIDCLKIDQSFVQSLSVDNYNAHIIQAIISLAHALEMDVIAEGIETEEQLDFMRAHGCDHGQGFLFFKPMSADNITPLIAKHTR